ncbi:GNAT family N-acetyltransferase [Dactylosporangium roseum]|uniref:GNAT family N-acetyltransferase n=1 Tax=Dactylosporangium roseum TaxID=47989 RepID=A0ABY5YZ83_9ACTN|nr:GNAT family N-acetyltransferase [Dactylosporangium roseum]UWZ35061.1 GNAT family N-acetyltransferase [Dactylosporangium roseum]
MSVRTAGPGDLGAVTGILAEAFLDGDLSGWLVPDRATRRTVYAGYFRIFAEFFLAHGLVETTGDLDAVALWWPVDQRLDLDIPGYDERLATVCGPAVGRFVRLDLAMHNSHPTGRPHHYLAFLAVHPDRQGEGLGSALLRHRHAHLDELGVPAYLEATNPRNRGLYERHGYRPREPIHIPDGPSMYPMWR